MNRPHPLTTLPQPGRTALQPLDLALLQSSRAYPSVSILASTDGSATATEARLRTLVTQARSRLLGEFRASEVEGLVTRLDQLVGEVRIDPDDDALGLFANCDLAVSMPLPLPVRERVVVDETFATRDLVHALHRSPRYWVLVLDERVTRLYWGLGATLEEQTDGGFPAVDAGDDGREAAPAYGVDRSDQRDARMVRYVKAVDAALAPHLGSDRVPLILVGAGRRPVLFAERSKHRARVAGTVAGAFEGRSPRSLARHVWPTVAARLEREQEEALDEVGRALGAQRCASGIDAVWQLAGEGRGALLVVEEGFAQAARLDVETSALVPADDVTHPEVVDDVVDEVIEAVLAKKGRAVIVPDGSLTDHARIALKLRH